MFLAEGRNGNGGLVMGGSHQILTAEKEEVAAKAELLTVPFPRHRDRKTAYADRKNIRLDQKPLGIAVKVINHLGDEVMKVFKVQ